MLPHATSCGIKEAGPIAAKWNAHYRTFQAIMRWDGVFVNTQRGYNYNAELAEPFMQRLDSQWARTFNQTIVRIAADAVAQFNSRMSTFSNDFTKLFKGAGSVGDKKRFEDQLSRFIKSLDSVLQNAVQDITKQRRDTNRMAERSIRSDMHETYQTSYRESRTGMLARMRGNLARYLTIHKGSMYRTIQGSMNNDLNDLMTRVKRVVLKQMTLSCNSFRRDCDNPISHTRPDSAYVDERIRRDILRVLKKADSSFEAHLTPTAHNAMVRHCPDTTAGPGPSLELVLANLTDQMHIQGFKDANEDESENESSSGSSNGIDSD